jgi:hypothetical protein
MDAYGYCYQNPIVFTDPDGMRPYPIGFGFGYSISRFTEVLQRKSNGESWTSAYYNTYKKDVKNVVRYATPIEDIYGAFSGKDFDDKKINKITSASWAVVAFIPFGKASSQFLKHSDEVADIVKQSGNIIDDSGKAGKEIITTLKTGKETFDNGKKVAQDIIGDLGDDAVEKLGKFGSQKDKVVGYMSKDGKKGWRVDFDIKKGGHINWWNGNKKGAILIKAGENQINQIIKNEIIK